MKTDFILIVKCTLMLSFVFVFLGEKVMADDEFTCDLFRFLQLLCEGHNNGKNDTCPEREQHQNKQTNIGTLLTQSQNAQADLCFAADFQNYLRTQTGSTTTINIIICTVDYLLRLQVQSTLMYFLTFSISL